MPDDSITPDAIAVCQHPDGEELHIPLADMSGACFCSNGDYEDNHGVRAYVAVDALLSDEAIQAFLWEMHTRGWLTSARTRDDWAAGIAAAVATATTRDLSPQGDE